MSVTFATSAGGPSVNFNNRNAAEVLRLLGLPVEPEGEATGELFLGRVLLALNDPAVEVDDHVDQAATVEGRWTEGGLGPYGRRAGYLRERLTELHEVGMWARDHAGMVWWC